MSTRKLAFMCLIVCLLLGAFSLASAQSGAVPIAVGQNAPGELNSEVSGNEYALTSTGGETVNIQVLALSGGLIPRFQVYNPSGVAILDMGNPGGSNILSGSATLADAGTYVIAVQGENGTTGQFVLSLQPGTPPPPAEDLVPAQPVTSTVGGTTPVRIYRFSTSPGGTTTLSVLSQMSGAGMLVSLYDETAGRTIATSDDSLGGVTYHLLSAQRAYRVEVRSGDAAGITAYTICLGCAGATSGTSPVAPTAAPALPTETPLGPQTVACTVVSTAGETVNVRSGPDTRYAIIGGLPVGQAFPVTGQYSFGNFTWYQVDASNGRVGWVSAGVTRLEGDCSLVPNVPPPTNAQLAPTAIPNNPPPPVQTEEPSGGNPPPPQGTPDLQVTITQLNRPNGEGTEQVALGFNIENRGDGSAPAAGVQVCVDGGCSNAGFSRPLNPGETDTFFVTLNLPPKPLNNGQVVFYDISVTVDPDNQIAEQSKNNNTYPSRIA